MLQHIKADVHCLWDDHLPIYRIFVDDDLITERTFIWHCYRVVIRENLVCDLEPGIHTLRVEAVNVSENGGFRFENFILEGRSDAEHPNHHDPQYKQITFIVNP